MKVGFHNHEETTNFTEWNIRGNGTFHALQLRIIRVVMANEQ